MLVVVRVCRGGGGVGGRKTKEADPRRHRGWGGGYDRYSDNIKIFSK